jgi:hypothetical protein
VPLTFTDELVQSAKHPLRQKVLTHARSGQAFGRALVGQAYQQSAIQDGNQVDLTAFRKEIYAGPAAMWEAMKTGFV